MLLVSFFGCISQSSRVTQFEQCCDFVDIVCVGVGVDLLVVC